MGVINTISEGGQTWAHRMRMLKQVLKLALLCAAISAGISLAVSMSAIPKERFEAYYYQLKIELLKEPMIEVRKTFWAKVTRQHFSGKQPIKVPAKRLEKICTQKKKLLKQNLEKASYEAAKIASLVFSLFIVFFLLRGLRSKRKKHLSGTKLVSHRHLALKLFFSRKRSFLKIGPLTAVKGTETQHFLISGGTGTGKTNLYHTLLPQIRQQGHRAVIVDTTGDFASKYYRPGKDILLNPFDSRSQGWNPWIECKNTFDYDSIAESFIPALSGDGDNHYWRNAAKDVFSAILHLQKEDQDLNQLKYLLIEAPLSKLCAAVADTPAAAHLDINSEKTSHSIRSMAMTFLSCFKHLTASDDLFSIRDWVQDRQDDSWLFLSATPSQRASIAPLLSSWFSISMRSLLQMPIDIDRRLWFIADELPTLNKLKDLETCLTEGRKYGACALLAIQSPAQLEKIYGGEGSQIIMGNCNTKIAFSEQDPQVAQKISKIFGEREVQEYKEGISYGANTVRDGVSLNPSSKVKPVVSASEIQSLDKHEAFVKLPGKLPVTKVKLKYQT